jgi:ankyrin repeat protein
MSGEVSDDDEDAVETDAASCLESVIEDNRLLCELAKYMIDEACSLGKVKLAAVPRDDAEVEGQVNQVEEEGRFELFDSILTVTDSMGKTPLHILCEHSADTNMMKTILESTREHNKHPKAPSTPYLLSARDSRGSTPLHYLAYSRQCPFSSLEVMMDHAKPSGEEGAVTDVALCRDHDGDTPLHWALDGYMSARRIKQLIRYNKDALYVKNAAGKLPFDQFVGNFVDNNWDQHELCGREAWDNIQSYLKVVVDQEDCKPEEWFPVHVLAGSPINFPGVFMDIALYFNKEDPSKPDLKGHLPLHSACARTSSEGENPDYEKMAIKVLRVYPQAAYKPSGDTKRLAIHIAIENKKPLPLIAALVKAYPNSLNIKDPRTGLWPFLLAGSCYGEHIDISYGLLRADPSIIQIAIRALISKSGQRFAQAVRDMELNEYANDHSSRRMRRFIRRDD